MLHFKLMIKLSVNPVYLVIKSPIMIQISTKNSLRTALILLISGVCAKHSSAQDLSLGVKAPSTVKIDGKLTEWKAPLQYNKSTMVSYTVANDAQNIYFVITCSDQPSINKILANGITLVVNKEAKKRDKDALVLVYPVIPRGAGRGGFGGRPGAGGNGGGGAGGRVNGAPVNRQRDQAKPDTAALIAAHKRSVTAAKEFRITGVKSIPDTMVSIYNTYGIKTAINFDEKANLVYELALPLELMGLTSAQQTELAFNVKVNGIELSGNIDGVVVSDVAVIRVGGGGGGGGRSVSFSGGPGGIDMFSATDFWGKYKLIK